MNKYPIEVLQNFYDLILYGRLEKELFMNKNWIIILAILLIPVTAYWWLTRDNLTTPPSIAGSNSPEIIKFSSPMCYECQQLEQVFEKVFPKYSNDIKLRKIDVTSKDADTRSLMKEHNVKLVPTTVFRSKKGEVKRRLEGSVPDETLDKYLKELLADG